MVNPASAIGGPLLVGRPIVYSFSDEGAIRRILFEYVAADCQVDNVESDSGHIPPKT